MVVFYITGTSSGIGKALAEEALKIEDSVVYGFSRTNTIQNNRFKHTTVDLSDLEKVKQLYFEKHEDAFKVVLINNAGTIGDVKPLSRLSDNTLIDVFNLNTICPAILSSKIIKAYEGIDLSLVIVNISSGAGRHPIESWAPYCASKAAIDMFSQVVQAENGYDSKRIKVFSIAPGIVDTKMQETLRESQPEDFPDLSKFIEYKKKGQLLTTDVVARKILDVVEKPEIHQNVLLDVRHL